MSRAGNAERDASCVGKAEERRSTAAPITRIANVQTKPAPTAAKDCRCARAKQRGASNADHRCRPVHRAMACCASVPALTERSLAARTTLPADTLGISGRAGRNPRDPTRMARGTTGVDTGEDGDDGLSLRATDQARLITHALRRGAGNRQRQRRHRVPATMARTPGLETCSY